MGRQSYLKQARLKAAKYCAGGEKAPYQVMQKLLKWELTGEEAQSVLQQLTSEKFIDEERFARAYVNDKFRFNQWGKIRIKMELQQLRIDPSLIVSTLEEINPELYEQVMIQLATKKWNSLKDEPWARKQKVTASLVRKGFEMDLAIEITRQVSAAEH